MSVRAEHQKWEIVTYKVVSTVPAATAKHKHKLRQGLQVGSAAKEPFLLTSPSHHFHISEDARNSIDLDVFTHGNREGPACEGHR